MTEWKTEFLTDDAQFHGKCRGHKSSIRLVTKQKQSSKPVSEAVAGDSCVNVIE